VAAVSLWLAAFPRPVAGQTDPGADGGSSVAVETSAPEPDPTTQLGAHSPPYEWIEALPLDGVGGRDLSLLLSDEGGGDIDGALTWTSSGVRVGADRVSIQVFVEVEGRGLLTGSHDFPIALDVHGYLVDDASTVVGHLSQEVSVESRHQAELIEDTGLKFVGNLPAPPGHSSFRVLIRNRQTQRYFLGRCVVDLPTLDLDTTLLLPPLVADRAESWVIGLQHGLSAPEILSRLPGIAALPSAKPMWRAGEPLEVVLGGSDLTYDRRVFAQLLNRLGHPFLDADLDLSPYTGTTQGLTLYRASISAPDAPEGEYRLEIVVMDEDSNVTASQVLPVLIHDRADLLVWTDPAAPRPSARQRMASQAGAPASRDPGTADGGEQLAGEGLEAPADEPTDPPDRFVGGDPDEPPPSGPVEALALSGVGARGAALLLSGQSGGEVDGAVVWTTGGAIAGAEQVSIKVIVEVDGSELLSGSRELPIPIEIYGYLVDDIGTVTGHLSEGIIVTGRQWAERIEQTGLKFVGELRTPPGLHSFRILVRNRQTGRFFLSRRDLEVQSDVGARAYLLPPLVAEPEDSWMVVGQHGLQVTAVRDSFHGLESWPSAMPTWRSEEPLDIVLGSSELTASRYASARLVDRVGRPILDPDLEVGPPIRSEHGLAFYRASVAAPDVPAGEYRLEIVVTDSDSGTTASQSLPVLIYDQSTALVWTDPAAPRAVEALSMPPRREQPTAEELDQEAMRAAYVEALRLWSHGDALAAKRNLAELERPVEAAASARRWRQLFAIERITTLALAKSNPPSLMGVAFLHRDMYRWYLSRRETELAQHSWQMAAMMARIAPAIDSWNPPDGFTECLLLDLARNLALAGELQQARELLQVAVEVAPTSAAALLGLGALYERTGHPDGAVEELKTLVKIHPENHEGRLRLAVNRERLGADRAAEELLRGLLAPSSPLWIRTVAYQELGRLLVDQGRVEEADQLLREGTTQIPENQRLRVLLAHALDQAHQPREATAEIEHLGAHGAQQTTSPRYRYSMWPDIDADRVRATLVAAEAEGLAALQEALQ
jgi:tetratricopeptide (TPR) repeat protein